MVARVSAIALGLALVSYNAVSYVLASEALTVTRITVQGNERMSKGEVLALLDGLAGASLVTTDLERWRLKLLESPWVADASLRRMFPGTLLVMIEERRPIGIGRLRGTLFLVDPSGVVIDEFGPNYADFDLPIIDGLDRGSTNGGMVDQARAELAGRLMSDVQRWPGLASRVSQIDVSDVRNAVVVLKGDTALVRVGDERFSERLRSYLDLMPALRDRVPDIDYVDLRFDERVYVRPQRSRPAAEQRASRARGARLAPGTGG
jgi:cell division protein FtsQ